jgi:hypothetical protein
MNPFSVMMIIDITRGRFSTQGTKPLGNALSIQVEKLG